MWIHRELQATVWIYRIVGMLAIGCGLLSAIAPWRWPALALQPWIPVGFGVMLMIFGLMALLGAPRFWARASWVLEHVRPQHMRMRLRRQWWPNDSLSSYYIAELWSVDASGPTPDMRMEPDMRVQVLPPRWANLVRELQLSEQPDSLTSGPRAAVVDGLVDMPVDVHIDPADPRLVVISCARGIIWPQGKAGRRAQ